MKKLMVVFVSLFLVFGLAACDSNFGTNTTSRDDSTTTERNTSSETQDYEKELSFEELKEIIINIEDSKYTKVTVTNQEGKDTISMSIDDDMWEGYLENGLFLARCIDNMPSDGRTILETRKNDVLSYIYIYYSDSNIEEAGYKEEYVYYDNLYLKEQYSYKKDNDGEFKLTDVYQYIWSYAE